MLFNQGYDNSLWLILSGDKKNRDLILDFIKSIPQKLYEEINNYFLEGKIEKKLFGVVKEKKFIYTYSINPQNKQLYIERYMIKQGYYSEIFTISLFQYDNNIKESISIGTISYAITNEDNQNIIDSDKIDYSLVKSPFGIFLKKYCEYSLIIQTTFSSFDTIEEIDCCKFSDNNNLNKLVRKKQRKLRLR